MPVPLRPPALCLLALLWSATSVMAQPPVPPAPAAPSAASDVDIDLTTTRVAFDADGGRVVEFTAVLRAHTPAGVQQVGTLSIPFRQGAGTLAVKYVRVRKPDGRAIETPTAAFFDLPSPITQAAPTYSDLYQRRINVQAFQPGDTLEYAWELNERSLIPGHFSFTDTLDLAPIAGRQVIEVSWPSSVQPIVKSGRHIPDIVTRDGRTTYRWDSSMAPASTETEDDDQQDVVRVTSFRDWAEVGLVIRDLWRDRAEVTPEIRAKALELTKGLTSNDAKARALYRYVSTSIRYVAVAIGLGRIQPNPAATVLANGFGDCKDKHVLLEALLRAVDIDATPVLIGPGGDVDRDVPSLHDFSHVITLIERGLPEPVWLDATVEVASFGFLIAAERDATVLTVPAAGTPVLMTTPARAAVENSWRTETTGRIDDDGRLQATVREDLTGDIEVLLRMTFRAVGRQQWEQVVRALPLVRLRGGTVADIVVTPPEEIETPFSIEYRYTAEKFVDWSGGTLYPPAAIDLPELTSEGDDNPIDLGSTGTMTAVSRIELPERIEIVSDAANVDVSRPFGHHRYRWSSNGRTIEAERELSLIVKDVPAADVADYRAFVTDVRAVPTWLRVRRVTPWAWGQELTIDWYENASPSTRKILENAAATGRKGDYQQAMVDVRRVLDDDPESDAAWLMLAWTQLSSGSTNRAFDTLQRRAPLAAGPSLLKYYAGRLLANGRRDEAADVLRSVLERFPADREAPLYLAETLVALQRGAEAVPLLLPLADRQQDSARYHLVRARAQFAARNQAASIAAFLRSAELDEGPNHLNLVAWELVQRDIALDDAVRLAERSVRATSEQVAALKVETVDASGLRVVASLPPRWDTLGWVHFKRGDFAAAVRYLEAAWQISQEPVIARNLLVVHARSGNKEASARYAEYADARDSSSALRLANRPELAWRVEAVAKARHTLARAWTIDLAGDLGVTTPIDAIVLIDRDGRVRDVRLLGANGSGSTVPDALRAIAVPWTPPDEHATQMLRRGTVSCAQGACSFQLRSTADAAVGLPQ